MMPGSEACSGKAVILPKAITHGELSQQHSLHLSTPQLVECPGHIVGHADLLYGDVFTARYAGHGTPAGRDLSGGCSGTADHRGGTAGLFLAGTQFTACAAVVHSR